MCTRTCFEPLVTDLWEPPVPVTGGYSLSNRLHPLFQPDIFPNARLEVLMPVLRLCSRLITTDSVIESFALILCGETYRDEITQILHMPTRQERCKLKHTREMTMKSLEKMPYYLTFQRELMSEEVNAEAGFTGEHRPIPQAADTWLNGVHYVVSYNELTYRDLCRIYDKHYGRLEELDDLELQAYFELANSLLHELGHVAWAMRPEDHHEEPIMDGCSIGETGFDLENMIWGGTCQVMINDVLFLKEWPDASTHGTYKHHNYKCNLDGEAPGFDRMWRIPNSFLNALFQDSYWDTVVATKGAEALKVPRVCGCVRTRPPCICDEEDVEAKFEGMIRIDDLSAEQRAAFGLSDIDLEMLYTSPHSPYPIKKRKLNPACEFVNAQHEVYDPQDLCKSHKEIEPQSLIPEGCLILWDGTLISSTLKDKVERMVLYGHIQPPGNKVWEAMH